LFIGIFTAYADGGRSAATIPARIGTSFLSCYLNPLTFFLVVIYQVYKGELLDEDVETMSNYFYDLPTTISRRNRHIYPSSKKGGLKTHNLPDVFARAGLPIDSLAFVYPSL
jgi:hypothetical protein